MNQSQIKNDQIKTLDKSKVGLGNVENLKVTLDATSNPGSTNDNTQGYAIGSRWLNVSTNQEYVCADAATGAAVWQKTTGTVSPLTTKGDLFT